MMKTNILVINPNSSQGMTDELATSLTNDLQFSPGGGAIKLSFCTGPSSCPSSINNVTDSVQSATACLAMLSSMPFPTEPSPVLTVRSEVKHPLARYDGIVVACYSPHPLVTMLKESLPLELATPVVGIFETSLFTALQLGRTFGIVTTGKQWEGILMEGVRAAGIAERKCVGVRGTELGVHDLNAQGENGQTQADVLEKLCQAALSLIQDYGAEVIVLGCAGMASYRQALEHRLKSDLQLGGRRRLVPVVDGVRAAVETAAGLARMGLSVSRDDGAYAPP